MIFIEALEKLMNDGVLHHPHIKVTPPPRPANHNSPPRECIQIFPQTQLHFSAVKCFRDGRAESVLQGLGFRVQGTGYKVQGRAGPAKHKLRIATFVLPRGGGGQ